MGRYDDDAEEAPRTSNYDDEAPASAQAEDRSPSPEVAAQAGRVIKRGWGNADAVASANTPYAQKLKVTEDPIVIKFLEDEPYTSYRMHWLQKEGQKSYTCIADIDPKGCPLCDNGERPSARFAFNVALLTPGDDPVIKSYEVGPRLIDQLKNLHLDRVTGPLPQHYWSVRKTGKGTTSQTNLQKVKEGDLEEDFEIAPLTDAQLADLRKRSYDASIVPIPSYKTLKELVATELS